MGFSPICDPQDFIQKSGSVTFVLLWCPNFMQKLDKTNGRPLRYPKKDHRRKERFYGMLVRSQSKKSFPVLTKSNEI